MSGMLTLKICRCDLQDISFDFARQDAERKESKLPVLETDGCWRLPDGSDATSSEILGVQVRIFKRSLPPG